MQPQPPARRNFAQGQSFLRYCGKSQTYGQRFGLIGPHIVRARRVTLSTPLMPVANPDVARNTVPGTAATELPSPPDLEVASHALSQPEGHGDPSEDAEVLQASIRAGSVAQIVVAVIAVIGLICLLKLVLVTTLASLLLAFVLEPVVSGLSRDPCPAGIRALLAVLLMVALAIGLTFFFYGRAVDFATQLPKYSGKIRSTLAVLRAQTSQIEESTRSVIASPRIGKTPIAVEVQEAPGLSRVISAGGGTLGELFLAISFAPFLVYFMLTWKDHAHSTTVRLFPKEHRLVAHRTVGRISTMIRGFIAGNVLIGLINTLVSTIVFWQLGIPYFYFLGVISGFASLVPYVGVFLALLPPLAGGMGIVNRTGVLVILLTVVGLHVVTLNVLYPKIVGKQLRLNPLAITLSLLFWAWIWGAMGLILAVPIIGATKIICDYIDPLRGFGAWLGD
jgi:predicted PurR-regulated permease PerM